MTRAILATWLLALMLAVPVAAEPRWPDQGWQVIPTSLVYDELLVALRGAVDAEGMFAVTEAGPTEAAANRGATIPGNLVVGVFRNNYAVRILQLSVPAMIEDPMRFYVTNLSEADMSRESSVRHPLPSREATLVEALLIMKAVVRVLLSA